MLAPRAGCAYLRNQMVRRPAALVIAIVLAVTAQVGYATPARAIRELRAVTCCATHCGRTKPASRAARCCQLRQDAGAPAVVASAPAAAAPSMVAVAMVPAATSALFSTTRLPDGHDRSLGRAGPVLLLTHALLL